MKSKARMQGAKADFTEIKQRAHRLLGEGDFDQAGELLAQLVNTGARDAEIWHLLGVINGRRGRLEEAVRCSRQAVAIHPKYTDAYFNLAQAYMHLRQYAEAVSAYMRVLDRYPDHVDVLKNSGYACYKLHRDEQALEYYGRALKLAPGDVEVMNSMGLAMAAAGRLEDAEICYRAALRGRRAYPEAAANLGALLRRQGRFGDAVELFEHELMRGPNDEIALVNLGVLMQRCARHNDAEKLFRQAVGSDPLNANVRSAFVFSLNYHLADPQVLYDEHAVFGRIAGRHTENGFGFGADAGRDRILRVGYISPDFRAHSIAYFIKPILECHNPEAVQSICYSDVRKPDSMTGRLRKACGKWRDVAGLSAAEVANLIRKDRVDILVDLAGHTSDNRLQVFAGKPAPVQVSYLGYPNTTGLPAIDYRLTDAWADPPGTTERYHAEQLARLPKGFICYQPPDGLPAVSELPALQRGYLTFGSFNNLAKVTPDVVALWARLLRAVPASRLVLKNRLFEDRWVCEHFLGQFRKAGVAEERVQLHGFLPRFDHFSLYRDIDIALDTFPYNGTTTTCEALSMGVPSITLAGKMHAGRVGVSILQQVGLTEWMTASTGEYVEAAVYWSKHTGALAELRVLLRDKMAQSDLCNAPGFVQALEHLYRDIWATYIERNRQ